jgi:hypothetical protein
MKMGVGVVVQCSAGERIEGGYTPMLMKRVRKQLIPKGLTNFVVAKSAEELERKEVRPKALELWGLRRGRWLEITTHVTG